MPCPYFEPQRVASKQQHTGARLPLLDEYEGLCRAAAEAADVPIDVRFRCCNHGNPGRLCGKFPAGDGPSCNRFDVLKNTPVELEILCVEERNYAPVSWQTLRFVNQNGTLDPDLPDSCMRAQAIAFCRSFLKHFRK